MKHSLIIFLFFACGVMLSFFKWLPEGLNKHDFSSYALGLLMFLSGVVVGSDPHLTVLMSHINYKIFLVPLGVVVGSFMGALVVLLFTNRFSAAEVLSVSAGFGYYSLSSIIISELNSKALGVIALLTNIFREVITLLLAPLFASHFGKLSIIASGGATAMDTTLPMVIKYSGKALALTSILSGVVLSILVPLLIPIILKLNF